MRRAFIYLELSKARLCGLVLGTTAVGFLVAGNGAIEGTLLAWTMLGTALCALGANALNQYVERERDAAMERTRERPLPSGRLSAPQALRWGVSIVAAGTVLLAAAVNALTAGLGLATVIVYLGLYTPLKTRSPFCTLAGAVCGAIPPMMGFSAATGSLPPGAWMFGALLLVWQIPHFFSLAWMYRDDYERGGFRMLPVLDRCGRVTSQAAVLYALALTAIGPMLALAGIAGGTYAIGSAALGAALLALSILFLRQRTCGNARRLFVASIVYLPLLMALMIADRGPAFVQGVILASAESLAP